MHNLSSASAPKRLRAAVVGAGKFGGYHAAKYAAMRDVELVGIVDRDLRAAKKLAQKHGCLAFYNVETILGRVDLVSVATPATTHREVAVLLLEAGIHVYVEKPIACSLEDAEAILHTAEKRKRIVAVGHQERYILNRLYLDSQETPQLIECHRLNTWSGRATDVDVALDLMIHDIDLVLQLAPGAITIESSSGHEKRPCNNNIAAEFTVGKCKARLFASRRAERQRRTMRIEYPTGTVFIDFGACRIEDSRPITLKARFSDLTNGADGVAYDPLGLALTDFVRCVRTGQEPFVSGVDGRRALAVTLDLLTPPSADIYPHLASTKEGQIIPLFDLETPAARLRADIDRRIAQVLNHRRYIGGPEVIQLESTLAAYTGTNYCMTCSSGTSALTIALMAENLTTEDAVFIPAFTYNATCNAVITAGAIPVFVDVDKQTCNICPQALRDAIHAVLAEGKLRPAIILAVDLYGLPAAYQELRTIATQYSLPVLADAAQSFGGRQNGMQVGSLADMTATSFYPSKTLGGFGDGGALFTNDAERFARWQSVRWHGTDDARSESVRVGLNGRLDSLQCAVLLSKMSIFPEEMARRAHVASLYRQLLQGKVQVQFDANAAEFDHANGLFTIILGSSSQRNAVRQVLQTAGIATGIYYPKPLHQHKAFANLVLPGQKLARALWLAERVLSLPMSPFMSDEQVLRVSTVLLDALAEEQVQAKL